MHTNTQQETELLRLFSQITARDDRDFILAITSRTAARQIPVKPLLRLIVGGSLVCDTSEFLRIKS